MLMQLLGLKSFKAAGVMLFGLLAYDVFWVFGSPKVIGDNVMLAVATSDALTGPTRLLFPRFSGSIGEASRFPFSLLGQRALPPPPSLLACWSLCNLLGMHQVLTIPSLHGLLCMTASYRAAVFPMPASTWFCCLSWPGLCRDLNVNANVRTSAGLGDIAVPGLLACLALRYDASRSTDFRGRQLAAAQALQASLDSSQVRPDLPPPELWLSAIHTPACTLPQACKPA